MSKFQKKISYLDWQSVARSFQVGDRVRASNPVDGRFSPWEGTVTSVFPGIGMIALQTPFGNVRLPAEELTVTSRDPVLEDTSYESSDKELDDAPIAMAVKIAREVMLRESLYWVAPGRQYMPTKKEIEKGEFLCPKCDTELKKTIYKKRTKLYICVNSECLFCIKPSDILDRTRPDDVDVSPTVTDEDFDTQDDVDFFSPNDALLKSLIESRTSGRKN